MLEGELLTSPPTAWFNIHTLYVPPHTVYLRVLCGSENKQRLFPYTALTDSSGKNGLKHKYKEVCRWRHKFCDEAKRVHVQSSLNSTRSKRKWKSLTLADTATMCKQSARKAIHSIATSAARGWMGKRVLMHTIFRKKTLNTNLVYSSVYFITTWQMLTIPIFYTTKLLWSSWYTWRCNRLQTTNAIKIHKHYYKPEI